jgi:hypothetical protein
VEKPRPEIAQELFARGALWNTFIMAGAARDFQSLAETHLPVESQLFARYRRTVGSTRERRSLTTLYERLEPSDFSRDVLQASSGLGAVALSPCGWSDWGTPERVLASLHSAGEHLPLLRRLERSPHAAGLQHLFSSFAGRGYAAGSSAPC